MAKTHVRLGGGTTGGGQYTGLGISFTAHDAHDAHDISLPESKVFYIVEICGKKVMSSQQYHSFLPVSLRLFIISQGTQETNGRRHTLHLPKSLEPLPILEALSWLL